MKNKPFSPSKTKFFKSCTGKFRCYRNQMKSGATPKKLTTLQSAGISISLENCLSRRFGSISIERNLFLPGIMKVTF